MENVYLGCISNKLGFAKLELNFKPTQPGSIVSFHPKPNSDCSKH